MSLGHWPRWVTWQEDEAWLELREIPVAQVEIAQWTGRTEAQEGGLGSRAVSIHVRVSLLGVHGCFRGFPNLLELYKIMGYILLG